MTVQDNLVLLEKRSRHLAAVVENLRRYEAALKQSGSPANSEILGALKSEVWKAESALNALRATIDRDRLAALTPDEIQQVRRQAQEDAIAEIARAKGWQWEEDTQRWRTVEGSYYSRIGEPL